MPLYEYQCETCSTASNGFRSSRIRSSTSARPAARDRCASCFRLPRFSSRARAGTSPTTRRSRRPTRARRSAERRLPTRSPTRDKSRASSDKSEKSESGSKSDTILDGSAQRAGKYDEVRLAGDRIVPVYRDEFTCSRSIRPSGTARKGSPRSGRRSAK